MLNKAKDLMNSQGGADGSTTGTTNTGTVGGTQAGNAGGQQEDYGDKALDFIEKKTGHTMGRDTNEKITDGARGIYGKATGKTLDPKYSN